MGEAARAAVSTEGRTGGATAGGLTTGRLVESDEGRESAAMSAATAEEGSAAAWSLSRLLLMQLLLFKGRQLEQGVSFLAQVQLLHLPLPLQQQQEGAIHTRAANFAGTAQSQFHSPQGRPVASVAKSWEL